MSPVFLFQVADTYRHIESHSGIWKLHLDPITAKVKGSNRVNPCIQYLCFMMRKNQASVIQVYNHSNHTCGLKTITLFFKTPQPKGNWSRIMYDESKFYYGPKQFLGN